jgi:hypothetical protein
MLVLGGCCCGFGPWWFWLPVLAIQVPQVSIPLLILLFLAVRASRRIPGFVRGEARARQAKKLARAPTPVEGANWAAGEKPNGAGLDEKTRAALEALWLDDARREHGEVAAVARVSMLLTAAGAPVGMVLEMQRTGAAKVAHAQALFAVAAGYGRRSHGVEQRPELMRRARKTDVVSELTSELLFATLHAGFRADEARAAAKDCAEPVARGALEKLAFDEHARSELSWDALRWLLGHDGRRTRSALRRARWSLMREQRPRHSRLALVLEARANVPALRGAGRLTDQRRAALWAERVRSTVLRAGKDPVKA